MTDAQPMKTMYQISTAPVDDAGNFYFPVLVPTNVKDYPVTFTDVAPTQEQLAAGKALKFNWATQTYVPSGADPIVLQMAQLAKSFATQTAATKQQLASIGLAVAKSLKPADEAQKPDASDATTTTPSTDSAQPAADSSSQTANSTPVAPTNGDTAASTGQTAPAQNTDATQA
ncbi:hypothetical protein [Lacticaseibacillus zhaodongensis]|uniref:hypothetical protein n=1 Tax=Lacticaseibacillus zhaodongensis TaxID=2668065 RepID=UPI0012D334C1|nr:hypothetical protein [Lacticaseibacillus zhaodongensis]